MSADGCSSEVRIKKIANSFYDEATQCILLVNQIIQTSNLKITEPKLYEKRNTTVLSLADYITTFTAERYSRDATTTINTLVYESSSYHHHYFKLFDFIESFTLRVSGFTVFL